MRLHPPVKKMPPTPEKAKNNKNTPACLHIQYYILYTESQVRGAAASARDVGHTLTCFWAEPAPPQSHFWGTDPGQPCSPPEPVTGLSASTCTKNTKSKWNNAGNTDGELNTGNVSHAPESALLLMLLLLCITLHITKGISINHSCWITTYCTFSKNKYRLCSHSDQDLWLQVQNRTAPNDWW